MDPFSEHLARGDIITMGILDTLGMESLKKWHQPDYMFGGMEGEDPGGYGAWGEEEDPVESGYPKRTWVRPPNYIYQDNQTPTMANGTQGRTVGHAPGGSGGTAAGMAAAAAAMGLGDSSGPQGGPGNAYATEIGQMKDPSGLQDAAKRDMSTYASLAAGMKNNQFAPGTVDQIMANPEGYWSGHLGDPAGESFHGSLSDRMESALGNKARDITIAGLTPEAKGDFAYVEGLAPHQSDFTSDADRTIYGAPGTGMAHAVGGLASLATMGNPLMSALNTGMGVLGDMSGKPIPGSPSQMVAGVTDFMSEAFDGDPSADANQYDGGMISAGNQYDDDEELPPLAFKDGGMPRQAQELAARGRHGDTTLAHVNPLELEGIARLFPDRAITRNPDTGLPEMFNFKQMLPMIAGIGSMFIPGLQPWGAALISGAATAIAEEDIGKGVMAGLMSYGMGSLMSAGGSAAEKAATQATTDAAAQTAAMQTASAQGQTAAMQQIREFPSTFGTLNYGPDYIYQGAGTLGTNPAVAVDAAGGGLPDYLYQGGVTPNQVPLIGPDARVTEHANLWAHPEADKFIRQGLPDQLTQQEPFMSPSHYGADLRGGIPSVFDAPSTGVGFSPEPIPAPTYADAFQRPVFQGPPTEPGPYADAFQRPVFHGPPTEPAALPPAPAPPYDYETPVMAREGDPGFVELAPAPKPTGLKIADMQRDSGGIGDAYGDYVSDSALASEGNVKGALKTFKDNTYWDWETATDARGDKFGTKADFLKAGNLEFGDISSDLMYGGMGAYGTIAPMFEEEYEYPTSTKPTYASTRQISPSEYRVPSSPPVGYDPATEGEYSYYGNKGGIVNNLPVIYARRGYGDKQVSDVLSQVVSGPPQPMPRATSQPQIKQTPAQPTWQQAQQPRQRPPQFGREVLASYMPSKYAALGTEGGVAEEIIEEAPMAAGEVATVGIMAGAPDVVQEGVREEASIMNPTDPQNAEERAIYDKAVLALEGELEPSDAQNAVDEYIEVFGAEAYRSLKKVVDKTRETGGIVKPANGETTVSNGEFQGEDVIAGKIVNPTTGAETANLRVGENEYIKTGKDLAYAAAARGLPPTPENGAMVEGMEEEALRRAFG